MTRAKGKAIKKARTMFSDGPVSLDELKVRNNITGPLYITGSTVGELMNQLADLPEDMLVLLETNDDEAVGIGFDRVAMAAMTTERTKKSHSFTSSIRNGSTS